MLKLAVVLQFIGAVLVCGAVAVLAGVAFAVLLAGLVVFAAGVAHERVAR